MLCPRKTGRFPPAWAQVTKPLTDAQGLGPLNHLGSGEWIQGWWVESGQPVPGTQNAGGGSFLIGW